MTYKNSDKPTFYNMIDKRFLIIPIILCLFGSVLLLIEPLPIIGTVALVFGGVGLIGVPYWIYNFTTKEWKIGVKQNWKCFDCNRDISNDDNWHYIDDVICCVDCGKIRVGRTKSNTNRG